MSHKHLINIDDLKVSGNIEKSQIVWEEVSNAAKTNTVTELIEITAENGQVIRCTPEHQIYTKNRGYVQAQYLEENDVLCTGI